MQVFSSLQSDDISAFLPPGYKEPPSTEEEEVVTTTEKAKEEYKLSLSKLFESAEANSALLPPGFTPDGPPSSSTERISLKFPTRPASASSSSKKPEKKRPASGPPPFVPRIKSFAER